MSVIAAVTKSIIPLTLLPRVKSPVSFYDLEYTDINGEKKSMSDFKGKHVLIVNTASKCGFTYQYEGLQDFYKQYSDKVEILGFPCNQFRQQEPGDTKEIADFCEIQYGVKFPLTQKIDVKGPNQHPVYRWLCSRAENGVLESTVEWNFQKYWVDDTGALRAVFYTNVKPSGKAFHKLAKQIIENR